MNWDALGAIGETIGAIAVLITLGYLALQIRQNTAALRSAATQGAHDQVGQIYRDLCTDSELAMIFVRGCENPDELSDTDTAKFYAFLMQIFFYIQNWHSQTNEGLMDEDLLSSWLYIAADMSKTPGFRRVWEDRKHLYSPALRTYLETEVFSREGATQYAPLGVAKT